MLCQGFFEPGDDLLMMPPWRAVLSRIVARQAVDKSVEQVLLDGPSNLWVDNQFRVGFGEPAGLPMQTKQAGRVNAGGSKDCSSRRCYQIDAGEGPVAGGKAFRSHRYESPLARSAHPLMPA